MKALISVIIPVYNVEEYLPTCLASVVDQQYKDLEIILVDDGSTDNSGKICDEWANKDDRIRVIRKKNEGVSEARNTGLKAGKGQFIGFVDADDWIEPEMYSALVERIIQTNADVAMCGYFDYPRGIEKPVERGIPTKDGTFEETALSIIRHDGYFTSVWNKLYRRGTIFRDEKTILMDSAYSFGEDEVWLYEVLRECRSITYIPKALYHWRPREDSMVRTPMLTKKKMSIIDAKKKALELLPSSKPVQITARGEVYNRAGELRAIAYITKDRENYKKLKAFMHPFFFDFLRSSDLRIVRKIKVIILTICMSIRMPKTAIETINNMR